MTHPLRRPLAVLAILLGTAGTAMLPGPASQAEAPAPSPTLATTAVSPSTVRAPSTKPTIVMVHGAWADSSGWQAELAALRSRGYPVIALANPLRGLSSDAAYIRSALETIAGPIVLVGHSYGGAVITNAASGLPRVKALVYVAAFAPDEGEPLGALTAKNPGSLVTDAALVGRPFPLPGGGSGVDLYLSSDVFRAAFAADLPRSTTRLMEATQRPLAAAAFGEPSGPPAWRSIPSWYLVATQDKTIPPATQRFMAQRAGAEVVEVRSSHVAMQSRPGATTRLILRAVRAVR